MPSIAEGMVGPARCAHVIDASHDKVGLEQADLNTSELTREPRGLMLPRPVAVRTTVTSLPEPPPPRSALPACSGHTEPNSSIPVHSA